MNNSNFHPGGGGGGINPALLSAFQNQQQKGPGGGFGGTMNPAHLINGASGGLSGAYNNPTSQQQLMQQQLLMQSQSGGGGGGSGINPAALASSSQHQSAGQPQLNMYTMLNAMGMNRDQFAALSNQERHQLANKFMQQQHGGGGGSGHPGANQHQMHGGGQGHGLSAQQQQQLLAAQAQQQHGSPSHAHSQSQHAHNSQQQQFQMERQQQQMQSMQLERERHLQQQQGQQEREREREKQAMVAASMGMGGMGNAMLGSMGGMGNNLMGGGMGGMNSNMMGNMSGMGSIGGVPNMNNMNMNNLSNLNNMNLGNMNMNNLNNLNSMGNLNNMNLSNMNLASMNNMNIPNNLANLSNLNINNANMPNNLNMNMAALNAHDRPPSAASSHSHSQGGGGGGMAMMPPPGPHARPPTAQGGAASMHQQGPQSQGQSRPGTSMSHRASPGHDGGGQGPQGQGGQGQGQGQQGRDGREGGGQGGRDPGGQGGQQQRPQSRMTHRNSNDGVNNANNNASNNNNANALNGAFKPGQGQGSQGQGFARPPSASPGASSNVNANGGNANNNAGGNHNNVPPTSASPTIGSPYRGAKRSLVGETLPGGGGPGPGSSGGNGGPGGGMNNALGMNLNLGNLSNLSGSSNMGGSMGMNNMNNMGNMSNMNHMNPMSMGGGGGMGPGNMNMNNNALGGGMPGSPRVGPSGGLGLGMGGGGMGGPGGGGGGTGPGGIGLGMPSGIGGMNLGGGVGAMGPPGLPRSVSGDGIGGGGMGLGMTNMGGIGGGGNINNMNMNMMMNGARGSPRPQSSMGMVGIHGGGGGMGPQGMNNMGMNVDSPARGGGGNIHMPQGGIGLGSGGMPGMGLGPQTPMRQGSLPPSQGTPHNAGAGGQGLPNQQALQQQQMLQAQMQLQAQSSGGGGGGGMRQGSLPPSGANPLGPQQGLGGRGPAGGMGMGGIGGMNNMGMNNMNAMNGLNMGGASSPHPGALGSSGMGGMGGAPSMAPSISASSLGSVATGGLPSIIGPQQITASAAANAQLGGMAGGAPVTGGTPSSMQGALSSSLPTGGGLSVSALPNAAATTGGAPTSITNANGTNMAPPPPLPASVNLNPKTTEVAIVPLLGSDRTIPALSTEEIAQIKDWMNTDRAYEARLRQMQARMHDEARDSFGIGGTMGPNWWDRGAPGNGFGNPNRWRRPRETFDVRYPRSRRDVGRSGRKGARREGLRLPRKINPQDANKLETLVPIRIEFDVEHHKMRDTFVWNINDPVVTPEAFAQSVVEDYSLAPAYHSIIVKSIQDQLSDFRAHSTNYDAELSDEDANTSMSNALKGELDDAAIEWWDVWRRRVQSEAAHALAEAQPILEDEENDGKPTGRPRSTGRGKRRKMIKLEDDEVDTDMADNEDDPDQDDDDDDEREEREERRVIFANGLEDDLFRPVSLDEMKVDEQAMHEDMRILIKLDIIVGSVKLDDQFEWDLDNPGASPEEFAEVYTQELGLGGEFKTAISHLIREQVQTYQKSLFLVGHPSDGTAVQDDDLKQSFLPSLTSGARPVSEVQMFTPLLNYLSDGELDRTEKERDKDLNKRRKRNTRGRRGIALPDREPIRTYRTPAIGFPELDAATLALAAAANAPMSRRAAAAAASLTIANMVASENGTAFLPQTMPSAAPQPPPTAPTKEKKPKGLFKGPTYPQSVLRPRAHVIAPTLSTAADVSSMPSVQADNEAPQSSSSGNMLQQDYRGNRLVSAKRAKELEREAKEKEFVDGQHPNYIDGVWHCSNCGCPESIAVGRRKGPLGDKSQCGTCGKFWHRHRRPRPVEYNSDPDFHSGIKQKEHEARTPGNKKKGAAAALRAQSAAHSATPADASEPQTPTRSNGDLDGSRRSPTPSGRTNDDDRAMSPVSTASSASEPPLAQRVKLNGASNSKAAPATPVPAPATHAKPQPVEPAPTPAPAPAPTSTAAAAAPASPTKTWPPAWLSSAIQAMQVRYPHDKFEVILRKVNASSTPEWRIKCLDCPGKLYTPGPGETLSNYDVHLKNRQHRQRVNERLANATAAAAAAAATSTSTAAEGSSDAKP